MIKFKAVGNFVKSKCWEGKNVASITLEIARQYYDFWIFEKDIIDELNQLTPKKLIPIKVWGRINIYKDKKLNIKRLSLVCHRIEYVEDEPVASTSTGGEMPTRREEANDDSGLPF